MLTPYLRWRLFDRCYNIACTPRFAVDGRSSTTDFCQKVCFGALSLEWAPCSCCLQTSSTSYLVSHKGVWLTVLFVAEEVIISRVVTSVRAQELMITNYTWCVSIFSPSMQTTTWREIFAIFSWPAARYLLSHLWAALLCRLCSHRITTALESQLLLVCNVVRWHQCRHVRIFCWRWSEVAMLISKAAYKEIQSAHTFVAAHLSFSWLLWGLVRFMVCFGFLFHTLLVLKLQNSLWYSLCCVSGALPVAIVSIVVGVIYIPVAKMLIRGVQEHNQPPDDSEVVAGAQRSSTHRVYVAITLELSAHSFSNCFCHGVL